MFDDGISGVEIRVLFSLLRGALVEMNGDPLAALCTPLGSTGPNVGAFALHADLYVPELLINVFDQVDGDTSGASILLPVSELPRLLAEVTSLDSTARASILNLLQVEAPRDRFHELYDLLHGTRHPWTLELARVLSQEQARIKFERGQGYLLNDRKWLHGREEPRGGVPESRLHRLAFSPEAERAAVTETQCER